MNKLRQRTNMPLSEASLLLNDLSLRQTWLSGNFLSEPLVSVFQILECGERQGRTIHGTILRGFSRIGIPGAVVAASSTFLGTVGWGALIVGLVASNLVPKANQKVINSVDAAISHIRGKL